MSTRIVTVFGATGAQGSSVVKALLADGTFTPRAVTRDVQSEKALKLKQLGVEVVQGDVWDVDSLKNAMNGAEAVFAVTAFWDKTNFREGPTSEVVMGKNMIDAAIAVGVKFYIWSSLPHASRATNGKYRNILHYDNKADVEEYLRNSGLPHANLHTGWFCANTWNMNFLTAASDSSSYELTVPNYDPSTFQYFTWVERDLGQCALALLKHYKDDSAQVLGQTFYAVSDKMSYTDYAKEIEKAIGKPVHFVSGAPTGIVEIDETHGYQSEFGAFPHATIPDPRLERFGVKFHSMKTLAEEELKMRYT